MTKFVFDKHKLSFVQKKTTVTSVLEFILKWIGISFLIAVFLYFLFALVFSTDRERKIAAENEYMEEQYKQLSKQMDVIDNVIAGLEIRDSKIYQDVFNSNPPRYSYHDTTSLDISSLYLKSFQDKVWITHKTNVNIQNTIYRTEKSIRTINEFFTQDKSIISSIPSIFPIKDFDIAQTGASIGQKVSPFLKNFTFHDGLDMMAPLGTDVIATADGTVIDVQQTQKGSGNLIKIAHNNGYVTSYAHLNTILVKKGQYVEQGSIIARVGSSGMSFVTHLHYSIEKDGVIVDPLNYFFADLTPDEYQGMINLAMNTGQSMD